ncbi:MAG TPA: hypothetical protein VGY57_05935 [Vicinamibacterales bacterium]|nr:hypothetical protein [Vicinamibacterales bacterium]
MIRTNLSTRPFYNERAVHAWLLLAAVLVIAASIFNISRLMRYSGSNTQQETAATRDEARAAQLRDQAARLRASVDLQKIEFASIEARQANELIDRRTFSWTDLFNRFETTLPDNVRIVAVRPRIDRERGFVVVTNVVSNGGVEDVNQFMENLEKTGAFADVTPVEGHVNDQGQLESQLEITYLQAPAKRAGGGTGQQ